MKAAIACLLLVALIATPRAAEKWTYGSSAHFEVYTTGGDAQARDALQRFERVHAFFTEFLKLAPRQAKPTRLIVFSGAKQFDPYRPTEAAFAYYMSAPGGDVIVMQDLDLNAYPAVAHEYAHLVMRYSRARYPIWLNEGLAEFFSTMAPEGNRMSIGALVPGHMQQLNHSVLLPLDRLFAVTQDSPEYNTKAHAGLFYAESWALTHMLITDDRYRGKSDEFLRLMGNGASSADALTTLYGKTPQAFDAELTNYVRGTHQSMFLVNYKALPQTKPATRAADPFEGALITASLLGNFPNKERDARAAFEQLEAQKPNDLSLVELRGAFEFRHGHRPEAVPYFARAVELGSTSPSLYRDYALAAPARSAELMERALALSPDDVEVRLRYAQMLVGQRKAAEAVTTVNALKEVPPDYAFRAFQVLANAYTQLGQLAEARAAAARVVQFAQPGTEADYAARLMRSIEDVQSAQAQAAGSRAVASAAGSNAAASTSASTPSGSPRATGSQPSSAPGAAQGQAASGLILMTGRLKNVVCGTAARVLELDTGDQTLRLLVDNPNAIVVRTPGGAGAPELTCGEHDLLLRVGFLPSDDAARKTVGLVRRLEY